MPKPTLALACMLSMSPEFAMAHTSDIPHSHPHLMDLSQALPLILLLLTAVALFYAARRIVVRRRT